VCVRAAAAAGRCRKGSLNGSASIERERDLELTQGMKILLFCERGLRLGASEAWAIIDLPPLAGCVDVVVGNRVNASLAASQSVPALPLGTCRSRSPIFN